MSNNGSKTARLAYSALALALASLGEAAEGPSVDKGRAFWAFQPIGDPSPPARANGSAVTNAIDAFAPPSVALGHASLVRKLYLDLHGLPPTPEQIDAFLADTSEAAYKELVDGLIASRRFAERWGRHWLGVVRYADSTGGGRAILHTNAWRFRDYVIDSFHTDRPFAEFVTDQIAGDLLEHSDPKTRRDSIVATGFLAMGPTNYELQDKVQLRMDVVDEQIDTMGRAFMGMSLGCARCHDHLFDPIPTADYYALAGIFRSTKTLEHDNVSKWISTTIPPISNEEHAAAKRRNAWENRVAEIRAELAAIKNTIGDGKPKLVGIVVDDNDAEFEGSWTVSTSVPGYVGDRYLHDEGTRESRQAIFRRSLPEAGDYEVRIAYTSSSNRTPVAQALIRHADGENTFRFDQRQPPELAGFKALGTFRFDPGRPAELVLSDASDGDGVLIADAVAFVPVSAEGRIAPAPAVSRVPEVAALKKKQLNAELTKLEKARPENELHAMSVIDEKEPADHAINIGGNTMNLGDEVPRGFLTVATKPGTARTPIAEGQSGRLELARWLTSDEHPLVARVYANRVWYWLTGKGIVPTPDNFGATGKPPSNPELLDHLAHRFLESGGSTKDLVRYIVSSQAYRSPPPEPRRIDAETLRDTMLAVSGELDLSKTGGPSMKTGTTSEFGYRFDSTVRSVFTPIFRNNLPELFEVFDFPDPSLSSGSRTDTTLSTQALYMMNHRWVIQRAKAASEKRLASRRSSEDLVRDAYVATLSRPPNEAELRLSLEFLGAAPDVKRLAAFQQSLFASLDFRHY